MKWIRHALQAIVIFDVVDLVLDLTHTWDGHIILPILGIVLITPLLCTIYRKDNV